MDAERYRRVRALFQQLVDADRAERERVLSGSNEDPELLAHVRAMLDQDHGTLDLARPLDAMLGALAAPELAPGSVLGAWTLGEQLGEGGMGAVYAARRSDGHFNQDAAIKLLRGIPSAAALTFLARERQILAGLAHPNIARLLDGGTTPQGQPYLVLEYVDGVPIDRHCREHVRDCDVLLDLLEPVCAAVAYAHARLVVHCDLKPGNILVRADGRPCLLDFGIARLLDESSGVQAAVQQARAFTPGYASPEQEAGGAVTTATDVYGLGRLIAGLAAAAGLTLDAELQAVVARASAADPAARYASVAALAEDLRHYRQRRPLAAMPQSAAYRGRKWLQRRWPLALTGSVFVATVCAFTWQLAQDRDRARAAERQALVERDHATSAEQTARQISAFLVSMLDAANPDAGSGEVPVSLLVQQAVARIDDELAGQPAVQAELHATLADVQRVLRNGEQARASYRKAIALERSLDRPLVLADLLGRWARLERAESAAVAAVAPARESLALYRRHAGADQREALTRAILLLGSVLADTEDNAEGMNLLREAVASAEQLDPAGPLLAEALLELGSQWHGQGDLDQAEAALRRSHAILQPLGDRRASVNAQEVLARLLVSRRKFVEAEGLLRDALVVRRELEGEDDAGIPWRLSELGRLLDEDGRSLQALPLFDEAIALAVRKLGADSAGYAVILQNRARSRFRAGDFAAAETDYREALTLALKHWGAQESGTATMRNNYGMLLVAAGRLRDAQTLLRAAESARATRSSSTSPQELAQTRLLLAEAAVRLGQHDDAHAWLAKVDPGVLAPTSWIRAEALRIQALLKAAQGDRSGALAGWLAAEQAWAQAVGPNDARAALARLDRAEYLARSGDAQDRDAARVLAGDILSTIDGRLVPASPWRQRITRLQ